MLSRHPCSSEGLLLLPFSGFPDVGNAAAECVCLVDAVLLMEALAHSEMYAITWPFMAVISGR